MSTVNESASPAANEVDQKTLDLLNGFVRESKLHHLAIPEVISLCAKFYYLTCDYFAKYADSYRLELDQMTIHKLSTCTESAFGAFSIHSMSGKIHCWKFKVLRKDTSMSFGITDYSDDNVKEEFMKDRETNNYGAKFAGHKRSRGMQESGYNFYLDVGTVVKMELDLKEKKLVFHTDDQCVGAAYKDIKCGEDIYYKMGITFFNKDCSVKLLEYSELD